MATAYLREYAAMGLAGALPSPQEPGITTQTAISTSATSAQSAAFDANTRFVAISSPASQAVGVAFGSNPTADANSLRLPANGLYFFGVKPGEKVALIDVA